MEKRYKCKRLIKELQSNLNVQRKRRVSMVKQSRPDIAQLLKDGQLRNAFYRAEQLHEDERRLSAYDQIDHFCECIVENIPHFNMQGNVHLLPDEVKEAMTSLIFAASRIGELRELQSIRNLFRERYGCEFDKNCVELCSGNTVNSQIKKSLESKPVPTKASPKVLSQVTTHTDTVEVLTVQRKMKKESEKVMRRSSSAINRLKMLACGRLSSLDGVIEERKMVRKENSPHVLPNLPEYEDFVVALEDFRAKQRR